MRYVVFVFALLGAWTGAATADYAGAMSAYDQGDHRTAFVEFRTLAQEGDPDSQYMLGRLYARGQGVLQDYVEAYKWLNLAASRGHRDAPRLRERIAERMTASQLAEAQRLSRQWKPGAPTASQQTSAPSTDPAMVADIQRLLNDLGYDAGPPDGVVGPQTRDAIRRYQAAAGLATDGEPSRSLRSHLQATLQSRSTTVASEPTRASGASTGGGATPRTSGDEALQALVGQLQALLEEAERTRSADRRFLQKLRDLVERYHWPWQRVLAQDAFSDGDYTRNPAWKVVRGRFWVDADAGLRSDVPVSQAAQREGARSGEDLAGTIIGAILEQATRSGGESSASQRASLAEIRLPQDIPNAFAVRLRVAAAAEGSGRLELGVYQSAAGGAGYRLGYNPDGTPGLELVRESRSGEAIVEAYNEPLQLEDGRFHRFEWTRDRNGQMTVSVDGKQLLAVADRGVSQPFDGFTLTNRGGSYALREITLFGVE